MNTGIQLNNVEIKTGDILYFTNIKNDALVNTFSERLEKGILDSVLVKIFKYENINIWSIISIPFLNNSYVCRGDFAQLDKDAMTYYKPKIDTFTEPPLSFLHDLFRTSKNVILNDENHIKEFNKLYNKGIEDRNWNFII